MKPYKRGKKLRKKLKSLPISVDMGQWVAAEGTEVTRFQPLDNAISVIDMGARQPSEFEPSVKFLRANDALSDRLKPIFKCYLLQPLNRRSSGRDGSQHIDRHGLPQNYIHNVLGLIVINLHKNHRHVFKGYPDSRRFCPSGSSSGRQWDISQNRFAVVCGDTHVRKQGQHASSTIAQQSRVFGDPEGSWSRRRPHQRYGHWTIVIADEFLDFLALGDVKFDGNLVRHVGVRVREIVDGWAMASLPHSESETVEAVAAWRHLWGND
jgi:hypothetical protein